MLTLALASAPSLSAATTAVPGIQKGPWHGKTKQGLPADFSVLKTQDGLVVVPEDVAVLATCEISGDQLEYHFGGGGIPLKKNGDFAVRYFDALGGDLRWSGNLADTTGTGTVNLIYAGLLDNDGLQLCPSGEVSWKAQAGAGSAPQGSARAADVIHVWTDRHGHSTWTVTKGMVASTPSLGAAPTAAPDVQKGPWHGKSKQGLPINFSVVKTDQGLAVDVEDIEVLATCEISGDQLQLGFSGGQLPLDEDHSFAIRDFDAYFGDFRWSGTLSDTTATGTISFTAGGLLDNDGLQLCPSGEVSWKAHAGAGSVSAASRVHPNYRIHVSTDRNDRLTWTVTEG
jgi:hypothetical protein